MVLGIFFSNLRWPTLQETNISPKNGILKMIFLFPRWDMLIPWRVVDFTAVSSKTTSGCGEICRQHLVAWLQSTPKVSNGTGGKGILQKNGLRNQVWNVYICILYVCVHTFILYIHRLGVAKTMKQLVSNLFIFYEGKMCSLIFPDL